MYTASEDRLKNWDTMVNIITDYDFSGEDVLRLLTDWHGMYLLDEAFMKNLIDCEL